MPYIPIPPPIRRPDSEELREMSIQNAKLALDQAKSFRSDSPLTEEKKEYLKELEEWLATYGDGDEWTLDYGIIRDTLFFTDLIRKVEVIGSYSPIDRSWLKMITKVHNKWIRDDNHKRNT